MVIMAGVWRCLSSPFFSLGFYFRSLRDWQCVNQSFLLFLLLLKVVEGVGYWVFVCFLGVEFFWFLLCCCLLKLGS